MPRYFFDLDDGNRFSRDTDGLFCADLQAARYEAMKALPDVAREVMPDGDRRKIRAIIREEGGRTVFEAILTLDARWL